MALSSNHFNSNMSQRGRKGENANSSGLAYLIEV